MSETYQIDLDLARLEGFDDGYERGRQAGYLDGYSEGIRQGREEGYEDGYAAGYDACESDVNYPDGEFDDDVFDTLPSDEEILDSENYHAMDDDGNFFDEEPEYADVREELGGEDE